MAELSPKPRPVPRPKRPEAPATPSLVDSAAAAEAAKWGRVDAEGNVWLRSSGGEGERIVGQYAAGGSADDALALYVRRFLDLQAQVALLESRVDHVSADTTFQALAGLREALKEPAVVGDVQSLVDRCKAVNERAHVVQEKQAQARKEAKEALTARQQAIVEEAEGIAGADPDSVRWRDASARMAELFLDWQNTQREKVRADKSTEEALWKRFSAARTQFERHRRQYFSERNEVRERVRATKEDLIKRAEELSNSTDWGKTSIAYRNLLDEWKAAGRGSRKEDDRQWERFRAAREVFYTARDAHNSAVDSEYQANLEQKEKLVEEAEALVPISDPDVARRAFLEIGERWDLIGPVPRKDLARIEERIRAVSDKIDEAYEAERRKNDPVKKTRSLDMAEQLQARIAEIEEALAGATGDDKAALEAELKERKAWLTELEHFE